MLVHTGIISGSDGPHVVAATTQVELDRHVAIYCRENWEYCHWDTEPAPAAPDDDAECIERYFECMSEQEDEWYCSNLTRVEGETDVVENSVQLELEDQDPLPHLLGQRKAKLEVRHGSVFLSVDGYGECNSNEGEGDIVMLELYQDELRVLVWPKINEEDPTIIKMEGARERARING